MANKKITELTALTTAEDVMAIVGVAGTAKKKTTLPAGSIITNV